MQLAYIRVRDAVLALALAIATCFAGASYRATLAGRFALASASPPPVVATLQTATPAPPPPVRVITKLPWDAAVLDRPASIAPPIARIRPGTVVEVSATDTPGWLRLRTRSGIAGWVSEARVASEAESSATVALFDSVGGATGDKVRAAHAGALYANPKLSERTGGFLRGERVEILRNGGRILLVAVADGAGGRLVGYAKTAEVRALAASTPPAVPASPRPAPGPSDPLAAAEPSTPAATDPGEAALRDAQDQYASGNFKDALTRAEEAAALGSSNAGVLMAMSACKLGDLTKALRHARRLRGTQLSQFRAACPAAEQSPPAEPASGDAAQSPSAPTGTETSEEP